MRPTSIVFLALSILLIIAGAITCGVANAKAEATGVAIFENETNASGEPITVIDLKSENTNKITLELSECNVEIIGGSETFEAELTNFEKYMYSMSTIDSELKLIDGFGVKSLVEISSSGISFDGTRYLFPFGSKGDAQIQDGTIRTVIIRIPSDRSIRKIDISLEKGDITFRDAPTKADITASTGTGNITVKSEGETSASYILSTKSGNITFDEPLCTGRTQLESKSGNITIVASSAEKEIEYILNAPLGEVTYFGTSAGPAYNTATTMTQKFTATAENGNITIDIPETEQTQTEEQ